MLTETLTCSFDEETLTLLAEVCKITGSDSDEVIRQALYLYDLILKEKQNGHDLAFVDSEKKAVTKIVLFTLKRSDV